MNVHSLKMELMMVVSLFSSSSREIGVGLLVALGLLVVVKAVVIRVVNMSECVLHDSIVVSLVVVMVM